MEQDVGSEGWSTRQIMSLWVNYINVFPKVYTFLPSNALWFVFEAILNQ